MARKQRDEEIERDNTLVRVGQAVMFTAPHVIAAFNGLQQAITNAMQVNGFWGEGQDNTGAKIALMHSELSEALEADRKGIEQDDKIPEFTGLEAELADTVIRILDFAGYHQLRLGEAVMAKMMFNLTRERMHGKKY